MSFDIAEPGQSGRWPFFSADVKVVRAFDCKGNPNASPAA